MGSPRLLPGRTVACCVAVTSALLTAGCGGSRHGASSRVSSAHATVTIDAARRYQRIAGFGVSEGFGQAKVLMSAAASVQQRVLSLLYSPKNGAGLTILRNEISADKGFTIEPRAPRGPNAKPSYLTLAEIDQDQGQLWFAKRIRADFGASVFADAWSAPGFMKTDDSAFGRGAVCGAPGTHCKRGDWRRAYADYLVQYAKDYAAAGVPLTYVGPENESNPLPAGARAGAGSPRQDSMTMSGAQTANFMQVLGRALARSGLPTRAECCASISWDWAQRYAKAIEADPKANRATAVFTSHGYFQPPGSPLRGWSKPVWQTEWAPFGTEPFDPAWDDGSPNSGFTWAQNIDTGLTAADLGAFLYLWGANTSTTTVTGPNTGLVDVRGTTVTASGRLWAFAGYSRFARPGAVRIGTTSRDASLEVSAFRNRAGSTAVVVLNRAHRGQTATFALHGIAGTHVVPYLTDTSHHLSSQSAIAVKNGTFTATLPSRSLVTYDIHP